MEVSTRRQTRLSFAELETYLDDGTRHTSTIGVSGLIARRLHRNVGCIYRWRREGIPLHTADQLAIHLNTHPAAIWPNFHEETP